MDVLFNCPSCQQELSVDAAGAGSQIECPTCKATIVVPAMEESGAPAEAPLPPALAASPTASSAEAKTERHFTVPIHETPTESLITKPLPPLEVAARDSAKKLRVKSIRRSDCVEVGKDHFDEAVTNFLDKVGEANVVKLSTFNYTHMDLATRAWVTDYGILVVYRG